MIAILVPVVVLLVRVLQIQGGPGGSNPFTGGHMKLGSLTVIASCYIGMPTLMMNNDPVETVAMVMLAIANSVLVDYIYIGTNKGANIIMVWHD